jgi:hypothetical protein
MAKKKTKGLSDSKLIKKYEGGKIDLKRVLKPALKKQRQVA